MDITKLKEEIASRRGKLAFLASVAQVHKRTLQRILNEDGYNPSYNVCAAIQASLRLVPKVKK